MATLFNKSVRGVPELTDVTTVMVFAPVASGKTWLLKQWLQLMERALVFDTVFEYDGPEYDHVWANPKELTEKIGDDPDNYKIAYHPKNVLTAFEWCFETMWQLDKPRWFVIEEVHEVSQEDIFQTLMKYARKRLLGVIGASQRIADVHKNALANARMIVLFYTHEARDLEAIRDRFGKEIERAVTQLTPCIYNDATGEVIQTPEILVYQRGKPPVIYALGDKTSSESKRPEEPQIESEENKDVSSNER